MASKNLLGMDRGPAAGRSEGFEPFWDREGPRRDPVEGMRREGTPQRRARAVRRGPWAGQGGGALGKALSLLKPRCVSQRNF